LATHVQHHEALASVPALLVLVLVWAGLFLRHPVTLWSFRSSLAANDERT
jgi:hypothetical protein